MMSSSQIVSSARFFNREHHILIVKGLFCTFSLPSFCYISSELQGAEFVVNIGWFQIVSHAR